MGLGFTETQDDGTVVATVTRSTKQVTWRNLFIFGGSTISYTGWDRIHLLFGDTPRLHARRLDRW
jgi:hypothetical protein